MSNWMNYIQMQKPLAYTPAGVPVTLTAIIPSGATVNIGNTTSDASGSFGISWTPTELGIYVITANFTGSQAYWASSAESRLLVSAAGASASVAQLSVTQNPTTTTPAQSATQSLAPSQSSAPSSTTSPSVAPPPSTQAVPSMMVYFAIAAAVVILAIVASVLLLKKRSK
jgi:hypothetical protein